MANTKDNRSLWKRVKETIQTIKPIEPGSYRAQSLSIETQRENALNWLGNEPHAERQKPEFAVDIPKHLLNDREFAAKLHERFGSEVADRVLPLEVKRSTEYQASTADSYQFLNAALQHDERSLQLEVKNYDPKFSNEDKQHAIDTVRRMGSAEALQFVASLEHGADTNAAQKEALNAVSHEVLGDKEFLLGLDRLGVDLNNLPQHVRQSDALMRECLEQSPSFFEVASTTVRAEQASFDNSLKNLDGHQERAVDNYSMAGKGLRENPENFLTAHRASMGGISPKEVPESIRNDKAVIEALLSDDSNALRFASRELRRDKQFITDMTAKYKIDVSRDTLIKDREVALNLTRTDSVQLDKLPTELQQDREFVLNVVRLNGEQLKFASSDMRDDFEIALVAAQQGHLEGCSERLRNDPYIVSKAMEADPKAIEQASDELRDSDAFGLLAVRADPSTIEALSERLRNSIEVAQAVIETDPAYTQFLGEDTRAKLIANLGQADREEYVYHFTEGEHDAASRAMSKGFEGMRATVEREKLEAETPVEKPLVISSKQPASLTEKINFARHEQGLPPVPPAPQRASTQVAAAPTLKQTNTFKI